AAGNERGCTGLDVGLGEGRGDAIAVASLQRNGTAASVEAVGSLDLRTGKNAAIAVVYEPDEEPAGRVVHGYDEARIRRISNETVGTADDARNPRRSAPPGNRAGVARRAIVPIGAVDHVVAVAQSHNARVAVAKVKTVPAHADIIVCRGS